MEKKAVLMILSGMGRGGMETFVYNLFRAIDKDKFQVEFLINTPGGDYQPLIEAEGGVVHCMPRRAAGYSRYLHGLDEFFKSNARRYAAVHYHHSNLSSLEPLHYAKKYGIPIRIIHSHNSYDPLFRIRLMHRLGKLFVKRLATHYLGCSDLSLDWMYKNTGARSKAVLINNGIFPEKFRYDASSRNQIRRELGIGEEDAVVGHIGRFDQVKNHDFLIDVFQHFLRTEPQSKLLLVGEGPLRSQIEGKIAFLNLEKSVILTGIRSDIPQLLSAMDIFVMPSLFEGLPVVLVEAQASGLPVVCSDAVSRMSKMSELFSFVPLADGVSNFVDKIHRLLSMDYIRDAGVRNVEQAGFDIHATARYVESLYLRSHSSMQS